MIHSGPGSADGVVNRAVNVVVVDLPSPAARRTTHDVNARMIHCVVVETSGEMMKTMVAVEAVAHASSIVQYTPGCATIDLERAVAAVCSTPPPLGYSPYRGLANGMKTLPGCYGVGLEAMVRRRTAAAVVVAAVAAVVDAAVQPSAQTPNPPCGIWSVSPAADHTRRAGSCPPRVVRRSVPVD